VPATHHHRRDHAASPNATDPLRSGAGVVTVHLGAIGSDIRNRLATEHDAVDVFETGIDWLLGDEAEATIGRLLLVDGESLLISSFDVDVEDGGEEDAVFAAGLTNGIVVIARRLVATGMLG
jgi:hypothetical protein